jgi:hypothetical protein
VTDDLVVYDKGKWHAEHATYPEDLDENAAYVYGGFFLAWAYFAGLLAEEELEDGADAWSRLAERSIAPGEAYRIVGGVLASDMLNDDGNAFAYHCFESEDLDYSSIFEGTLAGGLPSPYHVPDTWECFDKLRPSLDLHYRHWQDTISGS